MLRKAVVVCAIAGILLMAGADAVLAKAVKSEVAVDPSGNAKVMLNYCPDENQVIANVNCFNLEPETEYLVEVLDGSLVPVVMRSESFTTKADKSNSDNPNKNKPKPDKPKKHGKMKGHVNIHITWPDGPLAPPDLTTWSVRVTAQIPVEPTP